MDGGWRHFVPSLNPTKRKETMLKTRTIVLTMGLLALSGCATHEGPPKRAVKIAYVENIMDFYRLKHFPGPWKQAEKRLVVSHCKKDSSPGLWTCEVYIQDKNGPHGMADIKMVHEGGVWKAYNP